jgi:collagenase-like PrtC family protease
MKLSVATNWDPDLITELSSFPVCEMIGALAGTPVGGGRPSFLLARTTAQQATDYIQAVHDKGWSFNYLLNAPCMGNMEYDKETHRTLVEHLAWLCEVGVDTVTVSIPYLLQIIKRQFPQLKVKVSVIAHVNSIQRARFYESLGADEITLDYMGNRDFEFLRRVREAVDCGLTLLVNDMCLYECPYRTYHYNICGHASQEWHPMEGFYIDYCIVSCTLQKLGDPAQLIRSRWIRPEDLARYEALGYEDFKISGRRMSTAWLTRATAAYAQRRFDGNLMDILNGVTPGVDPDIRSPQYETLLSGAEFLKSERLVALGQLFPVKPFVDNRALDGFLDHYETQDCANACAGCNYCDQVAKRAVQLDEREVQKYIAALSDLQDDLISSRIFLQDHEPKEAVPSAASGNGQEKEDAKMEWESKTREDFEQIIGYVPIALRLVAKQVVAKASEDIATKRNAPAVQRQDMVQAFLQNTPDVFKSDMLQGLSSVGINPDEF